MGLNILSSQPFDITTFVNFDPLELNTLFWASSNIADDVYKLPNKATCLPKILQLSHIISEFRSLNVCLK